MERIGINSDDINLRVQLLKEWAINAPNEGLNKMLLPLIDEIQFDSNGMVVESSINGRLRAMMMAVLGSHFSLPIQYPKKLAEYESILQKEMLFNQITIDSREDFDRYFDEMRMKKDMLFRGVREAKWMLYSSLQREWIINGMGQKFESFQKFLENLVDNARSNNNGVIPIYLEQAKIDPKNDLSVLSILQNYGAPTPLLDWTYSFENALYFALDGINIEESQIEIDRYFSVYHIEEEHFSESSIREIIKDTMRENAFAIFKAEILENASKEGVSPEEFEKIFSDDRTMLALAMLHGKSMVTGITKIEKLINIPISFFSDYSKDGLFPFFINNTFRIAVQKGAFTWNSSPDQPLELVGKESFHEAEGKDVLYKFSDCLNINKSLVDYARQKLHENNVVKDFIYPNPESIAKDTFLKTKAQVQ